MADRPGPKPVLFITGHVPDYRVGALSALHDRERIELALTGGSSLHGGPAATDELPLPHRRVSGAAELYALATSGAHRAVVCSTAGRLAPVAGWAGARRAGLPLILWASLWSHPRTAAHALTYLPLRRLYSSADGVVTYGPHVSRYVQARGAHNVHVAPQAVDNDFWRAGAPQRPVGATRKHGPGTRFLFVGRDAPEKGLGLLLESWPSEPGKDTLTLVGAHGGRRLPPGVDGLGPLDPVALRSVYTSSDVLVVPSVRTPRFREPWGLVVNEAMNQGLAVIASDAVGAAAGGLVREGHNGLIFAAGDGAGLARRIETLAADPQLLAQLGAAAAEDVAVYSYQAWAEGFSAALASLGLSRAHW